VGLLLIAAAAVLYQVVITNRRVAQIAYGTEVSSVSDLVQLYSLVEGQVGAGLFVHRVGLQGTLVCDQPLTSDLSGTSCAAFRSRVERRWEEDYEDRDSHDKPVRRTRAGSEQVAGNERRASFWVVDASGRVLVVPDGARIDMETTVDRFEPGSTGAIDRFLPFQLELYGLAHRDRRRTLGYHFREEILPLDRAIYVLGMATDRTGALAVGHFPGANEPFIVSLKSREQVVHAARRAKVFAQYAAFICAALGIALLIAGILQHR
jgi:hypothetical protein